MRKIQALLLVLCFVAAMATADQTNVSSVNAVGYVKVFCPGGGGLALVAVPCNPLSTNASFTLDELIGPNMTKDWQLTSADNIYLWTGSGFNIAFLSDATWGPEFDGKWAYMDGSAVLCAGNPAYSVAVGEGFWVKTQSANPDRTLTLMGEVPSDPNTSLPIAGLTIRANPYPVARTLSELVPSPPGFKDWQLTSADNVYMWNGAGYDIYFLSDATWGPEFDGKWAYMDGSAVLATNQVLPGQAFWYVVAAGNTNFWLTVDKPYLWP